MLLRRRALLTATTAASGALAAPAALRAQSGAPWPQRGPIRFVAMYPPGGQVDTITRLLAPVVGGILGQSIVVENRVGGSGVIGTDNVVKSPPDGYSFVMTHSAVNVFGAATLPSIPFDPIRDFTHLALLVEAPFMVIVPGRSPFQSFDQYLAAARRQPVRYGHGGVGTGQHLLGSMLKMEANLPELTDVPYRGSGPALQDMLGGQIESLIDPVTTNVAGLRDGSLRALAVSAPQRLAAFPKVPTFTELGFPKIVASSWIGFSGPAGLPAPIAERLMAALPQALARPELRARFEDIVTLPRDPVPTGAAFVEVIRDDLARWTTVARQMNIVAS